MKSKYTFIGILSLMAVCLFSCKHEDNVTRWETGIVTPLLRSSMSINNLVTDTLLMKNSDNSLRLVYKSNLYKATIDSLFKIPDTSATSSARLETLRLEDIKFTNRISMGTLIKQIPFGPIFFPHGTYRAIPAITPQSSPDIDINGGGYFETMTLKDGTVIMKVKNELPVDLTDVTLTVRNKSDQSLIATNTIPLIKAGDTASSYVSIAGKTINKEMVGKFTLSSPGSNGNSVLIDTNKAILIDLSIVNLKPSSATAIFPAQNLIDVIKPIALQLLPVELKKVNLRHGDVVMTANSTLQDSLYLHYEIPSATKSGVVFATDFVLPPAPPNSSSHKDLVFDFTGYDLDLTGELKNTVNTLYTKITARIKYTGQIKTLSLSDSVYFHVGFKDLLPSYAQGYLGQQTINANSSAPLELFSKISSGTLSLESVKVKLTIENGIGVEESINITSITAHNTRSKAGSVVLTSPSLGSSKTIGRATLNPASPTHVTPTIDSIIFNNGNSNIKNLVELMPDKLSYVLETNINPNGKVAGTDDFVYYGTGIDASLDMEMPLNLIANKLLLKDTVDFKFDGQSYYDKISGGQLTLLCDNGFPLEANVQIYLLDNASNKMDSLISSGRMLAGLADAANAYIVTSKKRSKVIIPVNQDKIEKLKHAKRLVVVADFSSIPAATLLKIYSNYSVDFKLVGDFKYNIK